MISNYYHRQFTLEQRNTKSIKLKANQYTLQPFMIPEDHFHPDKRAYQQLKDRCEKIKSEFSFIQNQITRQHKKKKQKQEECLKSKIGKNIVDKQNRQEMQKHVNFICKKLLKMRLAKNENLQQIKFSRKRKQKQQTYILTLNQILIVGGPTSEFFPKKIFSWQGKLKKITSSAFLAYQVFGGKSMSLTLKILGIQSTQKVQ